MDENIKLNEGFTQVCIWPATIVENDEIEGFVAWMLENFGVRAQYLEQIKTLPGDGGNGDRNDLFFAIHDQDVAIFAIPRLRYGIRWIEDVLSHNNYKDPIYPKRVFKYKSW